MNDILDLISNLRSFWRLWGIWVMNDSFVNYVQNFLRQRSVKPCLILHWKFIWCDFLFG